MLLACCIKWQNSKHLKSISESLGMRLGLRMSLNVCQHWDESRSALWSNKWQNSKYLKSI